MIPFFQFKCLRKGSRATSMRLCKSWNVLYDVFKLRSAFAEEISSSVTDVFASRNTFSSIALFPDNYHWLIDFCQRIPVRAEKMR